MEKKVLIVDDVQINRDILASILENYYDIETAADGEEGIKIIREKSDELGAILLDLVMPNMDGYEVLEVLNKENYIKKIPVLIISSENSIRSEKECFGYGVSDFIRKPFDSDIVRTRVMNIVELYNYKKHLEDKVLEQTLTIKKWNTNIIELLGNVVESRNLESGLHVQRVKAYTKILAEEVMNSYPEYNLTQHDVDVIVGASSLHDVGKISVSDSILLKPGKLTCEEFENMKEHTVLGGEFIKKVTDMWDEEYSQVGYEIARYHHEKYDGRGYPDNLIGEEIPISAQIVSIADVYDALTSKRCYKDAFEKKKAMQMILDGECGKFNPKLMDAFVKRIDDFEKVCECRDE